ncbi:MAG: metalloregulator ArsR/SmtB family transcription factor [Candidatus Limnocylindrales bacterium]
MKRTSDPDLRLLQAAADPVRLSILRQLSQDGPTCACDFTDCCDIKQSTVSHHLKVLREAGWIEGRRRGTWIWYSIRPEAVERFGALAHTIRPGDARPAAGLVPDAARTEGRGLRVLQPDWRQW